MKLLAIRPWMLALLLLLPFDAVAQSPNPAPANAAPATADQKLLQPAELDALVAPIALYPDTLLANVLMAATYPLEVVQAQRWASENKNLKGDELKTAAEKQGWDDSVKALVATPSVLDTMSDKLDWTQKLGDAVLAQQPDVMDAIQRLRAKAYERKKLATTKQQTVTVRQEQNRQVIAIEPAAADTVYVPYYEPAVVYGDWPYPDYPAYPYYWGYPGYIAAGVIATGIAFGAGYALGRWVAGGGYWGGNRMNWAGGDININRGGRVEHWQHNPQHRQGVRYGNAGLQQKFGNADLRAGRDQRMDFRGRSGEQVLKPGGERAGVSDRMANRGGERAGVAERAKGADRGAANRPAAGNRARGEGAANRPAARPSRPTGGRDNALGNIQSGRAANLQSQRGRASFASANISRASISGGGFRGGGGGGFRGGGGRRSDVRLKHDIVLLGRLDNGLGFYRFAYNGSDKGYVGVMAQEVEAVMPDAVTRGRDGYLRVDYDRLGLRFETYERWIASGGRIPRTLH